MAGGNEVSVAVGAGNTITVAVAGATGTTPTITNGGTANVTVTSVGDRGPSGSFSDAQSINEIAATYTLVASDAGKLIAASHASVPIVITVPANSAVPFPIGTHVDVARLGVAAVAVAGETGVTISGTPGLNLRAQFSAATIIKIAANSWLLVGDISA